VRGCGTPGCCEYPIAARIAPLRLLARECCESVMNLVDFLLQ
jgi:hypothetical protein